MNDRVAVVGGGITGLSVAWFLAEQGAQVTLFDGAPGLGGLSVATDYGEFTWDRFYHVIAPHDRALLDLLQQLDLHDQVDWTPTRQAVWLDDRVHPLNGALDLLRLPGLSLLDKIRLGLLVFAGKRDLPEAVLSGQSSADWLRRRCGERAYQRFWRHLLRAKLGDAATTVSARFIHSTLRRLASARKSTGGGERFGYVRGGYSKVLERFVQRLRDRGVVLRAATPVSRVTAVPRGGVQVESAADAETFDRAVVTLPNPQLARVVTDLAPADAARLGSTPYLGVLCTVVVGRAPLSPNYILNLCDDALAITGVIETTNVVAREHTAGRTLVYLPRYAVAGSAAFAQSDAEVQARALGDLARIFPQTRDGWLLRAVVHRTSFIQAIPLRAAPPVAPPREVVAGKVYCVNNAQLPACILNNHDCIGLARAAVAALAERR
ncbi:MAG TPA: FAD-dependent oxidoreductase [Planctomycetota bacterium]|nr:FAD-dependent oxidoreductase [Planctomycetota bacterium]